MNPGERRRVELILPMRTVLLVAPSVGVLLAFRAIGDTFLVVWRYRTWTLARQAGLIGGVRSRHTVTSTALDQGGRCVACR